MINGDDNTIGLLWYDNQRGSSRSKSDVGARLASRYWSRIAPTCFATVGLARCGPHVKCALPGRTVNITRTRVKLGRRELETTSCYSPQDVDNPSDDSRCPTRTVEIERIAMYMAGGLIPHTKKYDVVQALNPREEVASAARTENKQIGWQSKVLQNNSG